MAFDLETFMRESHQIAKDKGWWTEPERSFGDQVALQHSELSEVLEDFRTYGMDPENFIYMDADTPGKPCGLAVEYADLLIRVFDTCERYGIPLIEALKIKQNYNKTRPHKHGGKRI